MIKRFASFASGVLGLALIVAAFYGVIRLVVASVRTFEGLDKQVAAALIAGFASVTVAALSVAGGRYLERRAQREQALREKKTVIYEQFIGAMFDIFDFGAEPDSEADRTTRVAEFMKTLTPQLVAWASDDVVATWSRTRRAAARNDGSPIDQLFAFEKVLHSIRKDLGHGGRRLKRGDLLGLFVTDVDEYVSQ